MSTITNEPIMLNETGLLLKKALDTQNGYLAMIAEGRRQEIYESMAQIAGIVRGNSVEMNAKMFPIGDQIVMPWKDLDDESHNTDETAYQVAWDIVRHGIVTLQDGSQVPGMFLQMHKCTAYGVQFSNHQAFMNCPDGLAAGTYNVTLGANWGTYARAGTSYKFTLMQAVPAGGRLSGFERMQYQPITNWGVKSWASPTADSPIETATVMEGSDGTALGTMNLDTLSDDGLNCMQRVALGHNRWSTSAIRQYLNSADVNWFSSKEDFDIRPNQYAKHGFMAGFNSDFLNAIKPVKVTTALNTAEGYTETTEDTFDTFFVPSLQQMNITPQLANAEGDAFDYWKRALGSQNFVGTGSANIFDAFKIPAINNNSAQYIRLRSPYRNTSMDMWGLEDLGYAGSAGYYAFGASRVNPVCVIC